MSRVRICLIPPFSLQAKYLHNEPHQHYLWLPQFLTQIGNVRYKGAVKMACSRGSGYNILDNGAFEGEPVDPYQVDLIAREYGMDEIVVPDILGDSESTFELVKAYQPGTKKYMAVVQGKSYDECADFVQRLGSHAKTEYVTVLGIPKHLLTTTGDPYVRIRLTRMIRDNYSGRYQVHLLGMSPAFIHEVKEAAHFRVRSMDTSLPFVAAYNGIQISDTRRMTETLARPDRYFRRAAREFDPALVDYNTHTLVNWAGGLR